jgi:hypothetical protein
MRIAKGVIGTALLAASIPAVSGAIELQQGTLQAWNEYIHSADLKMRNRLAHGPFLWMDESPDRASRVRRGETIVAPMVGQGTREAPNGLIHDWIGAAFIPNARIGGLLAVVHDFDRYKEVYKPVVTDSRMLACSAADQEFSMTWRRHVLFVNAAMEGQYREHDFQVDARRGYTVAETVSVQEIEDYGHPAERLLPPGKGNGFIWRLHSIARYEERDGGLYLELEVIALTRDIPGSLRWLVKPVVNRLSINSLTDTLRQTSLAVAALPPETERVALCNGQGHKIAMAKPRGVE